MAIKGCVSCVHCNTDPDRSFDYACATCYKMSNYQEYKSDFSEDMIEFISSNPQLMSDTYNGEEE